MPLVSGWTSTTGITLPGLPATANRHERSTAHIEVGRTFFETMQIPILLGRAIDARDVDGAPLSAIVNDFGPGGIDLTIVGVAKTPATVR